MAAKTEGVANKGTEKRPFDCFFLWQVVHAFRPVVTWFSLTTQGVWFQRLWKEHLSRVPPAFGPQKG
jgi:hypothetical protein